MICKNEASKDKVKTDLSGTLKFPRELNKNDQPHEISGDYKKLSVAEIRKKFESMPPTQRHIDITEGTKYTTNKVKPKNKEATPTHGNDDLQNNNVSEEKCDGVLSISNDDDLLYSIPLRPKFNKLEKLKNVLMEVVASEQKYVNRLHFFCDTLKGKVAMLNSTKYMIHWEDVDALFNDLSQVHKLHKDHVLPSFKQCLESFQQQIEKMKGMNSQESEQPNATEVYLGKSLIELSSKMGTYNSYAHNYTSTQRLFETQTKKVPQFASLVQQMQDSGESEGLKLSYYYIEPIQRLPRYELLLREYISCLEEDSIDIKEAKKALETVKDVNRLSNEKIKETENLQKLKDIESSIRESIDLHSQAGRWFVFEEIVDCIFEKGRKEERRFILLSDMLLVCRVIPFSLTCILCDKYNVASITAYHEVKGTIYLLCMQKALIFTPRKRLTLKIWQQKLNSAISGNAPRLSHSKSMGQAKSPYGKSRLHDNNNNNDNDDDDVDYRNNNKTKYNTISAAYKNKFNVNVLNTNNNNDNNNNKNNNNKNNNNDDNNNNPETIDNNFYDIFRGKNDYDSLSDDDDDEHFCYKTVEDFNRQSIYIKQVIESINSNDNGGEGDSNDDGDEDDDKNDNCQQNANDNEFKNKINTNNNNNNNQKNMNNNNNKNTEKRRKSEQNVMGTIGEQAPLMLNRQNVSSCMQCGEVFGFFGKRKSCYACGKVICTECSKNKECLRYMGQEIKRVCDACYSIIQNGRGMLPKMFNEALDGVG